jgi:hypothetical protein
MPSSTGSSSLLVQFDSEGEGGMSATAYPVILRNVPEHLNVHTFLAPETHIVRAQKF